MIIHSFNPMTKQKLIEEFYEARTQFILNSINVAKYWYMLMIGQYENR